MLIIIGIAILHVTCLILLLVATIDNAWWVTENTYTDIWGQWIKIGGVWNQTELPSTYPSDYLQAVQATSVLACVFSFISLIVFLVQLFTLPKGQKFIISGAIQFLSCLFIMIAASIYTDKFHRDETDGNYGHSFILAWIAFALSFFSALIYSVLRKK